MKFIITLFKINIISQAHFIRDGLENASFLSPIWIGKLYFSIQPAGSKKRRVKSIMSICGHDNFYIGVLIESIHLRKKFYKNSLYFPISSCLWIIPFRCNRVNFVNKYNRRRIIFSQSENVSYHSRTLPNIFLNEFRTVYSYESCSCMVCYCLCQHRFPSSRGSVHENA